MCSDDSTIKKVASAVSHELRVPLTSIKNSVFYLKIEGAEAEDPKIAQHISIINSQIDACVQMVSNMQSFIDPREPVFKEVRVGELLTEALSLMFTHSSIRVTVDIEGDLPAVMADGFQVRQLFDNIIRNAVEAMHQGGCLLIVTARLCGDSVVIDFEDTGDGIKPEHMDRLFEPLFTTRSHALGLGLAVCRQFADAHKGEIGVQSEAGKGTKVTVRLPLRSC